MQSNGLVCIFTLFVITYYFCISPHLETATSICTDLEDIDPFMEEPEKQSFRCPSSKQALNILLSILLALFAVVSPIIFIIMPYIQYPDHNKQCGTSCIGMYITVGVKEIVLLFALWALYVRPTKAFLPRLNVFKVGMMVLVYLVIICFWLFFAIHVIGVSGINQEAIVNFAVSFLDSMLFLHYMALILLWIRPQEKVYTVSVIRNVDGMRRYYNIGQNSIQKAAVFCLERYYIDFTEYNPYMPRPASRTKINKLAGLKFYDLDGKPDGSNLSQQASKAVIAAAAAGRRREGRNDRFYEEQELDRRIRKRKARLVAAAEEAFGHIARMNAYEMTKKANGSMDPDEAAQAVFPTLARPLQKYLRTTRQQLHYPLESILKHLSHCISFDLSSKAFVERYTCDQPCISYVGTDRQQDWTLISDIAPTRQLGEGTVFQLKHDDISLVIAVSRLPIFSMDEEPYNSDTNRFVFRLNSETSV